MADLNLTKDASERFWSKVSRTESCWNWTGYLDREGYGRFNDSRMSLFAHRVSYALMVGPLIKGLTIDHLCRNRRCVNPAHLEQVTTRVNNLRGISPPADNARKTHCVKGHPLDDDANTRQRDGRRMCRRCQAANSVNYKDRKRQKAQKVKKVYRPPVVTCSVKAFCQQGHELAANIRVVTSADGTQYAHCLTCRREQWARYRRKNATRQQVS